VTATWPRGDQRLERAYRRLLLAYPGRYRRRHGAEIVTTLLEMAAPGQRRPERADAWHLLASGLRQRFRLPAGRPLALIAAVLTTLITGAFGAAAGSWAGTQTFASLPDPAALAQQTTGTGGATTTLHNGSAWTAPARYTSTDVAGTWPIEPARQRLRADGWQVSPVAPLGGSASTFDPATGATIAVPMHNDQFQAEKDGIAMSVRAFRTAGRGTVDTDTWARPTPVFLPLTVTGTVLGLVAGWLLAAAGAYRLRRAGRRTATAGVTLAVLALALPAVALYGNVMRAFRYADDFSPVFTVHSALHPGPYYPFGPPWLVPALTITGIVLAAAATLIARPGTPVTAEQSPTAG
jgi:hypothetical protein